METFLIAPPRHDDKRDELDELMGFYQSGETDTLPVPSYVSLRDALANHSLIMVRAADGTLVAVAGYFEYARSRDAWIIHELAGTRVRNAIGRLAPIPLQQILLALRVLQVAATERGPLTLISSAKSPASIDNIGIVGLAPIDPLPKWFEFDTCSWIGMADRGTWKHFAATAKTLGNALAILEHVGLASGSHVCSASQKQADGTITTRPINLVYEMNWLAELFPQMLVAHRNGKWENPFVSLPTSI
jgi:hypothetical protein